MKGAPCVLTKNVNNCVKKGLVNGRQANMVSLTWSEANRAHPVVKKLYKGMLIGGEEYEVPFPESVNVEIYRKKKNKKTKKRKIVWRRTVPIGSLATGIPIPTSLRDRWGLPEHLNVTLHHVDLAFAFRRITEVGIGPVGVGHRHEFVKIMRAAHIMRCAHCCI